MNPTPDTPRYPAGTLLRMGGAFALVHCAYWALGIRYDKTGLVEIMHFIDPHLLQTRLLESLYYLHIQPPFMNLFVGLSLKIAPESAWPFMVAALLHGFLLYAAVFLLQRRFNVRPAIAAITSTVFMASPAFILWEHFLIYTLPCAAWLALTILFLYDYFQTEERRYALGAFIMVMLLCGTRSAFHIGFFVIVIGLVIIAKRKLWKQSLILAIIPFFIIFSIYFKNLLVFGEFTMCTFVEKNMWIMTAGNLPWDEKVQLVEDGKLSELSLVNRWASLNAYPPEYKEVPEDYAQIPALAETHKTTRDGVVNYNHYGNIAICDIYGEDAMYVLRHRPWAFVVATSMSWYRYFLSSSTSPVSPQSQEKIVLINTFYDYVVYGKCWIDLTQNHPLIERAGHTPFLFLLFGLPLLLFYGLWQALRPLLPHAPPSALNINQRWLVGFSCCCILMVAVLGCSFDFLETARYRFITDGLSVVLLGMLVNGVWNRMTTR